MTRILGNWQFELSLQITLVVVPVAVYFLILGLLNSSRRPHLLTSRTDFSLLLTALSPLLAVPLLDWLGVNLLTISLVGSLVAAGILVASPRAGHGWVVYNISIENALDTVEQSLRRLGCVYERHGRRFELGQGETLEIKAFPLLRNVTVAHTGPGQMAPRFAREFGERLGRVAVEPSPTAVSFVLISTAMLVAPVALLADRMPEMVRLLTDMIP